MPIVISRRQRPVWKTTGMPESASTSRLNRPFRSLKVDETMFALGGNTLWQVSQLTPAENAGSGALGS